MATISNGGVAINLGDSSMQALQALISSLAPDGASKQGKLSEEQVGALSERLSQVLGDSGDTTVERRNERGELLNEEDLPIVDITEPVSDGIKPNQSPEAFITEHDPVPLSALSEQDKLRLRAQRERILDMLEEEEEHQAEKLVERERRRKMEELAKRKDDAKAEMDRKLAAREMQKKLGKALLKNIAEQREQEEKQKVDGSAGPSKSSESSNAKPKKSVSFANVPDVDEVKQKPKPVAWGDVSMGTLRAGLPKARLKAYILNKQPMRLDVVEHVPGERREPAQKRERDSDDESNPEGSQEYEMDDDEENTPPLDGVFDDSGESVNSGGFCSEEDEMDLSRAGLQREVALEFFRLRKSIGAEAHQAMTSHTHEEWDQPEVPLEATLSSKPAKPNMSRFKAIRHANLGQPNGTSISLGASVLPQAKSSTLQRAVRIGKLSDGKLVGGIEGESASEDEENANRKRMLDMLRNGTVVDDRFAADSASPQTDEGHASVHSPLASSSSNPVSAPLKASRFRQERAMQKSSSGPVPGPSSITVAPSARNLSSPISDVVSERPVAKKPSQTRSVDRKAPEAGLAQGQTSTPFRKSPTVIPVPSVPSSLEYYFRQRRPFATSQVAPDPAVLSTLIIDSPSFPPSDDSANACARE